MTVSDVTMSSDGSSTSRVRQFGLYKTIDSQTAEFLKLSRKRQIRRGCACAAVSTAITVTVVVSALLVYEYGFRADFKMVPSSLRQLNWFQTVNDSRAIFNKNTPINKKNNGKLLAIILKALDQKRYLETIVEEHSSQRPAHERTTDYPFQKNVFADKNRRIPSKMYEVYKPTSQELFKARRRDSLAKARKVMDYQRVMTFLNTMTLSKRTGETIHTEVSSTSKPYITGNHKNGNFQDFKYQKAKATTKKESHNVYCTCPPRSNLTDILEKLYISIRELRPTTIERIPNNTKNRHKQKSKNNSKIKVQQPKYYSDQRAYTSKTNIQHTTGKIQPKLNTTIFRQFVVTTVKNYHITKNSRNKQNETTTNRNEEYNTVTYKNHNNSYVGDTMPWKLDFGITEYDDTSSFYIKHANNSTVGKMTESDSAAKYTQMDDQYDFEDKIYNTPTEPNQYLNRTPVYKVKTHENKRKTTDEYNDLSNYIDGVNKKFAKILIANKTQFSVEYPTLRPLNTKFITYEIVDPIKIRSSDTMKPLKGKEKQDTSHLVKNSNNTAVDSKNNSGSLIKQKDEILPAKPLTFAAKKVDEKIPLAPMLKSYLLSKKDSEILNLDPQNPLHENELQTANSEELPFNLKFVPNEEEEHVRILNDLHTAKVTTNTDQRYDNNKDESQAQNSREHSGASKAGKKEKIISLSPIWEPMNVSRKPLKSSTEAPKDSGPKKPKIKEIFYMTGGETPVEDFDANLRALMYYDKSPVNYTALANSYLNKIENDSIELSKSMLPESRPSPLEIRRNALYTSFEQT